MTNPVEPTRVAGRGDTAPPGELVLTSPGARLGAVIGGAALLLVLVDMLTSARVGTNVRIVWVVFAVFMWCELVLGWRAQVRADPSGVTARLPTGRSRHVAWADVHHFQLRGYRCQLGVWTVEGRWVGLMRVGAFFDRRAADYTEQLEQYRWHQQHTLGLV